METDAVQDRARERIARIGFFDALRGFTIISMVLFHAAYDACYLYGYSMPWFTEPVIQNIWRCSISWVFIALAGWMTSFSRNNAKRGAVYALAALVVYLSTALASVDTAISFGILFCMAGSTLLYVVLSPLSKHVPPIASFVVCLLLFVVTYQVPSGTYAFDGLAWLGFPSASFTSGDYYPLIPYSFLYLAGAIAARLYNERTHGAYPTWMTSERFSFLQTIGKHSLLIYLAHQPLLIGLFTLLSML